MPWLKRLPSLLTQFLLTSLFEWALGGITFFFILSQADNAGGGTGGAPRSLYALLIPLISALGNGLLIVVVANAMAARPRRKTDYAAVAGGCFAGSLLVNNVVFAWIGPLLRGTPPGTFRLDWFDVPYSVNPALVAVILFYLITREQRRTRRITEQDFELLQLQERRTKAELESLQARINPHFLYNALNSIASLIHEDPDRAERMVLLLSRFFRYSTNGPEGNYGTVRQELDLVQTYLEVEKVRFDERLQYGIVLNGPGLEGQMIPRFLLQPLVENAVKHGIARTVQNGVIEITITQAGRQLQITVHDNGPAFPPGFQMGYGLKSIEDKLRLLYQGAATFEVQNGPRKQVFIQLPVVRPEPVPVPVA